VLFNNNVAGTITACGRDLTKTMSGLNEEYWHNIWHEDVELHKKLYIKNVKKVSTQNETSVYADTDSCDKSTIIKTSIGDLTIEELYNYCQKFGDAGKTLVGHESVNCELEILNYSNENKLYFTKANRIIRHKVSKPKWKLKTKSGKEVIVTNDHSLIVFRNNKQIEVKADEVLKTDKILIIKS
jgi:hypothetical protein